MKFCRMSTMRRLATLISSFVLVAVLIDAEPIVSPLPVLKTEPGIRYNPAEPRPKVAMSPIYVRVWVFQSASTYWIELCVRLCGRQEPHMQLWFNYISSMSLTWMQ